MSSVLILGATSSIAEHVARHYAVHDAKLTLMARNAERLRQTADDLKLRGHREVLTHTVDFNDHAATRKAVQSAWEAANGFDVVLVAWGTLDDQAACEKDPQAAVQAIETNFTGVVSVCTDVANRMESRGSGVLAVIGSVAGDRGRRSNYVYGSAKAGVEAFCSGLRARLHATGVHVLTIKPGMVDTPMTAHLPKGPLFAQPEKVAADIIRAIEKRKAVIYTPFYWRWVMLMIQHVPEFIFKKLSF